MVRVVLLAALSAGASFAASMASLYAGFLSTLGGGNQIVEVRGFAGAAVSTPEPAGFLLIVAGIALLIVGRLRLRRAPR
jgi:hypothetical protein